MDMRLRRPIARPTSLLVALLTTLLLGACGGSSGDTGESDGGTTSGDHNQADVDFATQMIPHHAQALGMVDLTLGRDLSPEVARLAEDIRAAQGPEIEQMADWLQEWDEPVPETSRDHANAHGDSHGGMDSDMPGMMTEEQMADLGAAEGAAFERMFLEMMVEHHRGAVEMAQAEQEDGAHAPSVELAESIEKSQQAEIETMESLQ
jgi:uncharacterized protein (DUF305 family)